MRLRQELTKLITKHTEGVKDSVAKATAQSTLYEGLLQGLSVCMLLSFKLFYLDISFPQKGTHLAIHPKSQKEIAYWAEKEEEARRRIVSVNKRSK